MHPACFRIPTFNLPRSSPVPLLKVSGKKSEHSDSPRREFAVAFPQNCYHHGKGFPPLYNFTQNWIAWKRNRDHDGTKRQRRRQRWWLPRMDEEREWIFTTAGSSVCYTLFPFGAQAIPPHAHTLASHAVTNAHRRSSTGKTQHTRHHTLPMRAAAHVANTHTTKHLP